MAGERLKIPNLLGPGCWVLLWIRDGGGGEKQSKKTIQSLQMSPRMKSQAGGMC